MKRLWTGGLVFLLMALLMLAFALFVRPRLSRGNESHFSPGYAHFLDDVELVAGRHYRMSFSERMPVIERDPRGIARFEVYLEPLLEGNFELDMRGREYLARSELVGTGEIEVDCHWDGLQATKCSIDSSDHIDFSVEADGLYRVRIHNNGNRTANFLDMTLNRILLDWWIALILLVLAALAVWQLWRRSDSETRYWVLSVALQPWRWKRPPEGDETPGPG